MALVYFSESSGVRLFTQTLAGMGLWVGLELRCMGHGSSAGV